VADLDRLGEIARIEFADIVVATKILDAKLRVMLADESYIDFWWSMEISGRFAHHWQRLHVDKTFFRHDNTPDKRWNNVATFPKHYHDGKYENVVESNISANPETALREFLSFARSKIISLQT
jgi:hypothetical protein